MSDKVVQFHLSAVKGSSFMAPKVVQEGEISGWVCDCGSHLFLLLDGGHIQCGRCFGNHAMQWYMPDPGEAA